VAFEFKLALESRAFKRRLLFGRIKNLMAPQCEIKSDSNPHYRKDVEAFFPNSKYKQFLGKRGSLGGQGELKKLLLIHSLA
jgi:hypothetical protein